MGPLGFAKGLRGAIDAFWGLQDHSIGMTGKKRGGHIGNSFFFFQVLSEGPLIEA